MLALMEMTNPIWEWLIAPIVLVSLGFFVGHFVGRWERREDRADDRQRRQFSAPPSHGLPSPPLWVLPSQDRRPYDWEKRDGRAERERRDIDAAGSQYWARRRARENKER
jgi:hypothetical protein